jgi:hypothetical protein
VTREHNNDKIIIIIIIIINRKIKIRDNEKGTDMLIDVVISGDRNMMKKEGEKILKYNYLLTRNSAHVECESKSNIINNRDTRNHFKIIQTITQQHSRKT